METVLSFTWTDALHIAIIIVLAFVFYIFSKALTGRIVRKTLHATKRSWQKSDLEKRQKTLTGLFNTIWRVFAISLAALGIFSTLFPDISLAPLFASAGIVGVALGFGAQSLVKDFLSGLFIISENQYRVGDIIEIEGFSGTVERIGARSTVIRDADGNVHYFPNGMVQHVINKTMGYSMARFPIAVHPSSNLEDIIAIINKTGEKLAAEQKWGERILKTPAFVSIDEFTSDSVTLIVSGKTRPSDQWAVIAEMRRRLLEAFDKKKVVLSASAPVLTKK